MFFKTEDLISSAKRSEFFPTGQTTFVDPDDLIAFANEEMMTKLVPAIMSVRQDFFLTSQTVNITQNISSYPLPERAIGGALKDLMYQPNVSDSTYQYPIAKTTIHDVQSWYQANVAPAYFYAMGDEVVILPKPSSTIGALVFYYFSRPSKLIPTTSCAKITAISTVSGTTTFTVDTDLSASLPVGSLIDFLSAKSPFLLWEQDVAVTAITSTTIAVSASGVQDANSSVLPKVGDYICPAQQANIPMIPSEFHPILAEMICFRALKALGYTQQMETCSQNIAAMLKGAFILIVQRVEQELDVVYERNGILNAILSPVIGVSTHL